MILRLEQYLARVAGGTGAIPESPETNTEAYLAILAGENRQAPEPITRLDMYLYNLVGGNYPIPTPNTRIEQYLAKACGLDIEVPTPITREEQLWHAIAQSSWQLTTLTGALPLSFKSKGEALTDYRIYGTADGAGVETESGEPTGYKLPMTMTSEEQSQSTPIYIGDTQLGAEEYVDYQEQKVYKRTANLWNYKIEQGTTGGGATHPADNRVRSILFPITENTYTFVFDNYENYNIAYDAWCGSTLLEASAWLDNNTFTLPESTKTLRIKIRRKDNANFTPSDISEVMLTPGSTAPAQYIPYLNPTDPPVPLPAISTYKGENTLSCSEGLGEVSITGYIKEVSNG